MPTKSIAEREQHVRNLGQQLEELFEGVDIGRHFNVGISESNG